jgi:hypothetical protein
MHSIKHIPDVLWRAIHQGETIHGTEMFVKAWARERNGAQVVDTWGIVRFVCENWRLKKVTY